MDKKYELIPSEYPNLYRVKALKDFGDVKIGDIGGFVQSEKNLSHKGLCWIYHNAKALDKSIVRDDATLHDLAKAKDKAIISGKASLFDSSEAGGTSCVTGRATMMEYSKIFDNARLEEWAVLEESSLAFGNAVLSGNTHLSGSSKVFGLAYLCYAYLSDEAEVSTAIKCPVFIAGYARVLKYDDLLYFRVCDKPVMFYRDLVKGIAVSFGSSYNLTIDDFKTEIKTYCEFDSEKENLTKYLEVVKFAQKYFKERK